MTDPDETHLLAWVWLSLLLRKKPFFEMPYSDHLSSDTDPGVIEQIQLAASSIDEGCQRPQNGGLYIDLNKLLEMEIFTAPLFRDACFNISSKKHLPPNFKASEHIGFEGLAKILLKIRDIAACIDGH